MIDEERVEKALEYLRDSSTEYGKQAGAIKAAEHMIKQHRALAFIDASGTVAEREAKAQSDANVFRYQEELEDAEVAFRTIMARRKAAELLIEVWRTQSASNRAKMI